MKYYSIPADFVSDSVASLAQLNRQYENAKIDETYGQIVADHGFGSGRSSYSLPQVKWEQLESYAETLFKNQIQFNYTLNASCMGNGEFAHDTLNALYIFVKRLVSIGITRMTVSLPPVIEMITSSFPQVQVKVSTVSRIDNVEKAMAYKRMGASRIVLDENLTRDFHMIQRICEEFDGPVEMICNALCIKNCIYENFHHNQSSHDISPDANHASNNYYSYRCISENCRTPSDLLRKNFIRPEDIKLYESVGVHRFKIQGRHALTTGGDMLKTVKVYLDETYDGNLLDILDCFQSADSFKVNLENRRLDGFIEPFYKGKQKCQDDCTQCGYCSGYMEKHFDTKQFEEPFSLASLYFRQIDSFKHLVNEIRQENNDG